MRTHRRIALPAAAIALLCLCAAARAGAPPITLRNGQAVGDLQGAQAASLLFRISVPAGAAYLEVRLSGGRGDCDLYVRHGQPASPQQHDRRSIGAATDERVRIDRPRAGWWYVLVFGAADYSGVQLQAGFGAGGAAAQLTVLKNNVVQYGLSGGAGSGRYFRIDVPRGATAFRIATSGGSGDCDLFVSAGKLPTRETAEHKSTGNSTPERVELAQPTPGAWYVLLYGYSPFKDVKMLAQYVAPGGGAAVEVLTGNAVRRGLSGAARSAAHFRVDVPPGTEELVIGTSGGRGDCDLFVSHQRPADPRTATHKSQAWGTAERVAILWPAPGAWYILVYGSEAYAGVDLLPVVRRVGPRGRIDITAPLRGPLRAGTQCIISWRASRGIRTVRIEYSVDDGQTWHRANFPRELDARLGGYAWKIPADRSYASAHARLRLIATGHRGRVVTAVSERLVVLPPSPRGRIEILFPRGGVLRLGGKYTIAWRAAPGIRTVQIDFSPDDGQTWVRANFPAALPGAAGKHVWEIPVHPSYLSAQARIRITGTGRGGRGAAGISERFRIVAAGGGPRGRIDILSPKGGVLRLGQKCTIAWRATPGIRTVQIDFSSNDGQTWVRANFPAALPAAAGKHVWEIPVHASYVSAQARIRIAGTGRGGKGAAAISERFQIVPAGGRRRR